MNASGSCTVKNIPNTFEHWEVGKLIGRGTFGKVYSAESKITNKLAALKIFQSKRIVKQPKLCTKEVLIHQDLDHPNVIKLLLWDSLSPNTFYMLLDFGQDIHAIFKSAVPGKKYDVQIYFKHLLKGLNYLHSHSVIHSDIKLRNLLIKDGLLKICDFGISYIETREQQCSKTRRGSKNTMAPEVYNKKPREGRPADMWSAGVTFFRMSTGINPWKKPDSENNADYKMWLENKEKGEVIWRSLDTETNDLLNGILQLNPVERLTANLALRHNYFSVFYPQESFSK